MSLRIRDFALLVVACLAVDDRRHPFKEASTMEDPLPFWQEAHVKSPIASDKALTRGLEPRHVGGTSPAGDSEVTALIARDRDVTTAVGWLRSRGFSHGEAGNVCALRHGLRPASGGWMAAEIASLMFLVWRLSTPSDGAGSRVHG